MSKIFSYKAIRPAVGLQERAFGELVYVDCCFLKTKSRFEKIIQQYNEYHTFFKGQFVFLVLIPKYINEEFN